jgi:hypothetical protein
MIITTTKIEILVLRDKVYPSLFGFQKKISVKEHMKITMKLNIPYDFLLNLLMIK